MRTLRTALRALPALSAAAVIALACGSGQISGPTDRPGMFNQVWSEFDQNYPFFTLAGVDWKALRTVYADSVASATSDREAARLIGGMIGKLKDYHSELTTQYGVFGPPPIPYPHHYDPGLVLHYVTGTIKSTASTRIRFAQLGTDVGYIYMSTFVGEGWGDEVEDALAGMPAIKSLIVDIRDNNGGNEEVAQAFAQRLYDRKRVYRISRARTGSNYNQLGDEASMSLSPGGSRRFSGPVALITNRFDGSSAEDFTLMMRILPQVTVVGDTTLGLGSNPKEVSLANGWKVRLSRTAQSTPDGFVYQFKGLPPKIPVLWNEADVAAGRDPFIDVALADLKARANLPV
jgi:carboxyl-terminal processing protease